MTATAMTTSHVSECPDIGPICDVRDEPPQRHDQSIWLTETRLDLEYPFVDDWAVAAVIPLRVMGTGVRFTDLEGRTLDLDYQQIHHRDETLVGVADPWLLGRWARRAGPWVGNAQAGVSLPLGRTEQDPFRLGRQGRSHRHVQFGAGTFKPVLGGGLRHDLGAWSPNVWALAVPSLYESGKGYRAGHRLAGGLAAQSGFGTDTWMFRLGLQAQGETAERWQGVVEHEDGNRGRFDLLADTGASWRFAGGWSVNAAVKVPVVTRVVGGQLDYPLLVELGLTRVFELGGHDLHHGHDHDRHEPHGAPPTPSPPAGAPAGAPDPGAPDPGALDIADLAPDGEAADLVPVPGKVTVFDFWASWCAPCRELDARLADLAARYPGRLAVRKLRVETWDVPAARRHLGAAPGLPYVVVHDADGALAFRADGDPAAIAARVEDRLRARAGAAGADP